VFIYGPDPAVNSLLAMRRLAISVAAGPRAAPGWQELSRGDAEDLAALLLGHAIYAPPAVTGWMHADLHPGN
jgi:hypothetical protein